MQLIFQCTRNRQKKNHVAYQRIYSIRSARSVCLYCWPFQGWKKKLLWSFLKDSRQQKTLLGGMIWSHHFNYSQTLSRLIKILLVQSHLFKNLLWARLCTGCCGHKSQSASFLPCSLVLRLTFQRLDSIVTPIISMTKTEYRGGMSSSRR